MTAEIGLEGHVEHLDKDLADIMAHPLLENVHQKLAVLFGTDGTVGYEVSVLGIKQALLAGLLTPALVCDIDGLSGGALDDRDELYPGSVHLVAEETIDRTAVFLVGGVDCA